MSLATLSLFKDLDADTLAWLQTKAQIRTYPAGRAVFVEDVWGNAVYFIVSGWLKICRSQGERHFTLAVLGPGEIFGEMSILDSATRSSDAIALSQIQLLTLNAADFKELIGLSPQFSYSLMQRIARRLRFTNQRLYFTKQNPVIRTLFALVQVAETQGITTDAGLEILNIEPQDWADMAEVDAETSTRLLQKLESEGIVGQDRQRQMLVIKQFPRLQQALQIST